MTNHLHLIAKAEGNYSLSEILRDFKKFTSKAIFKAISENFSESRREMLLKHFATPEGIRFWRSDNNPVELWSNAVITQKLNYIHQNPVEEGIRFLQDKHRSLTGVVPERSRRAC